MKALDLLITDDDLVIDGINSAVLIDGAESVAQDIKHMIRESGLMVTMIGERSLIKRKTQCKNIAILIGKDPRIIPGTERVNEIKAGTLVIQAKLKD
ncbi:MAG: DUF2590 family protein [Algicola sp.]|nr:DUF2590 family protein [Algicola sp.]